MTTPDRTLGVAVCGTGWCAAQHISAFQKNPRARVTWICDRDPGRLDHFGTRYPAAGATTDFGDLLADPDLDAVVIATPVFTHHELAAASLRAGKHTFVEKPLASSAAQAEELIALAQERGLMLMCGHTFLYSPPVREIKRLIESGALGEIYFISSSRVNLGLHQRDVSVVWDLAPHDFSILIHWLGQSPTRVSAVGRDSIVPGIPDVAFIDLGFPSGVLAHVELSWLAPSKLRRMVIVGSEKMVVYDDSSTEPVRIFDHGVVYRDPETFGQYQLSYRTGDIVSPRLQATEPLALELDDFVEAIVSGRRDGGMIGLARDVVALIEQTERAFADSWGDVVRPSSPDAAAPPALAAARSAG